MIAASGAESADTQHFSLARAGFVHRATSTCAGPCSLSRIATSTSVPSFGAVSIGFHSPRTAALVMRFALAQVQKGSTNQRVSADSAPDAAIIYAEGELAFWMPLPTNVPRLS